MEVLPLTNMAVICNIQSYTIAVLENDQSETRIAYGGQVY
jgi:hypothetical protein